MSTTLRLLAVALLLLALLSCETARVDTLTEVHTRGSLRVGVSEFEPWAFRDRHGQLIGFEIDVASKLAEDLGVALDLVPLEFDELIPSLQAGRIDVIISGISITPERALLVNFSVPYHRTEVTLLTVPGAPDYGTNRDDYDRPGLRIGAVSGTVGATTAAWSFPEATHVSFRDQGAALAALKIGEVDAVVASTLHHQIASMRAGSELNMPLASPLARTVEGFAVQKGDLDALAFLDAWVRVRENDQWIEHRRAYWFLSPGWESRTARSSATSTRTSR